MTPLKIGLLPFYLKLYDDLMPERRADFNAFIGRISGGFDAHGIAVSIAPVCRIAGEFDSAVKAFEEAGVDAVVTLHLAYSPSLESVDAFCRSTLPLILLDTTMDASFGLDVKADRIMYNHGVHGVMDFACMLRRRGRAFEIVAGHDDDPVLLDRAAGLVRAAVAAREMRGTRALRVGPAFKGMGDFTVEETVLRGTFGLEIHEVGIGELDAAVMAVTDAAVETELAEDRARFDCEPENPAHRRAVRIGLGLRKLLDEGDYGAMSVNFQAFDGADRPASTMPFLEISKAMARGTGYGGEGDVLTAAMVGALARAFKTVTFTEIFCADWNGNSLFLSHMGEISPTVAGDRPRVFSKPFFVKGVPDVTVLTCAVKPGPAVFVNLAPGPDDTFTLIVAPVTVLAEDDTLDPAMRNTVRTWVRPQQPVAEFLEAYSRAGGTHHSALVLGDVAEAIAAFGRQIGVDVVVIG
jgi:L-arabinose isomerase